MTEEGKRPVVTDAPGITWRKLSTGWQARWRPRPDLVRRGCPMKTVILWTGWELDDTFEKFIRSECRSYQSDMLVWSNGGLKKAAKYDRTIRGLIECYKADPDSRYHKLRHRTRLTYDSLLARVEQDYGHIEIKDIRARELMRWHEAWTKRGTSIAHSLVGMVRSLATFGATLLECKKCVALKVLLHDMRFTNSKPRTERLTAEHAIAIRAKAHRVYKPSIALAQAFQFECILRQKDVIGEWVPQSEPGPLTDIFEGNDKWMRGLRWEEIDDDLILRHMTSKRQKEHEVDLKLAPMVLEELRLQFPNGLPETGPVIISEKHGVPWRTSEFRRQWREIADKAGVPKGVYNMDSRAGAITEASEAGAPMEHIKQAATHGQIAMTERYARNQRGKTDNVSIMRVAHRNKSGT